MIILALTRLFHLDMRNSVVRTVFLHDDNGRQIFLLVKLKFHGILNRMFTEHILFTHTHTHNDTIKALIKFEILPIH